jgi:hypothetical protein
MSSRKWSRRTMLRALGAATILSPAILRQVRAQVNKVGRGRTWPAVERLV